MRRLSLILALAIVSASMATAGGRYPSYFFPTGDVYWVGVSPSGDWVAAAVTNGERHGLMAQRLGGGGPRVLQTGDEKWPITQVSWAGQDTLLARFGSGRRVRWILVQLEAGGAEGFEFDARPFVAGGWLVDALPFSDEELLWHFGDGRHNYVHRIRIDDLLERGVGFRAARGKRRIGKQVAKIPGSVRRWLVDSDEVVRAAVRTEENSYTILYRARAGEDFVPIANYEGRAQDLKKPFGFTQDGSKLIVAARDRNATIGIYEFDPDTRRVGREIFQSDALDVDYIWVDPLTRDVFSYTYSDGAETRRGYIPEASERFAGRLGDRDPDMESIHIVSSNADRTRFVFRVEGADEPGAYYLRDTAKNETLEIGQTGSKIVREYLSDMVTFQVTSTDGLEIEALLTVPSRAGPGPFPLLVMPHGGPIGVHDRREYRPDVQYFASWGYAILQANYRGSSGYGREFEAAGMREWARGIEDDLDAAIRATVGRSDIDGDRVCIIGGSYGGFSALASAIRHPEWFDCAVTINGVMDVPLMGETSDMADSRRVLEAFEGVVGDLERERDQLLAISPAYRVEDLQTPVMVVYGDRDRRVDRDHAERVLLMLEFHGHEHAVHRVEGGRHRFTRDQRIRSLPAIRAFFDRHMAAGAPRIGSQP